MNTADLLDTLKKVFIQPTRRCALMLQGAPGVGKTSIVSQAAEAVKKPVMTIALPTCEAVDLRGLPHIVDGRTRWASPMPADGQGVLLLDEISSAAPDVQVAAHHLVWAEVGSDMSLPPGWHIVLTGNRASDKTLYRTASGPLRNRMTIIQVEAEIGKWVGWAMDNQIDPTIIGFLRWRPELLVAKEIPGDGAFPSPRAWHRASFILSMTVSASVEVELLKGTIGDGATTEFSAYLRTARELPRVESILKDPLHAEIPAAPSIRYAITTMLSQYTREHKKSAMEYMGRLPAEFALLYITDIRDRFNLESDPLVRKWVAAHKNLFRFEE
jgi:hypothetical protein